MSAVCVLFMHSCMEIGTCVSMWPVEEGEEEEAGPGGEAVGGVGIVEVGVATVTTHVCASS